MKHCKYFLGLHNTLNHKLNITSSCNTPEHSKDNQGPNKACLFYEEFLGKVILGLLFKKGLETYSIATKSSILPQYTTLLEWGASY